MNGLLLEPRRIAAVPNAVLDIVLPDPPSSQEASSMQATLPGNTSKGASGDASSTISKDVPTTRRNAVGGLVDAAWENYTHIDNPNTLPPGSRTPRERAQAPQDHIATTGAKDITQTIVNASFGDINTQVTLEDMYVQGKGVYQDYQAAVDWNMEAAITEDPSAQNKVGDL
ncbi:MAG: hypothetical protein J3R72DRAFT_530011 [Linnemannia gamsii]|nr:MAG: hypothetical protein J3R72DRAFT_530011 [Linnemannia gamsii]